MEGIQKKIAVLNDLSGYGRCSLTAAMPVISALKVQCCPVVTAVLSNHAGYPECYMELYRSDGGIPGAVAEDGI